MNGPREIICAEIARSGCISCARFMELALYHPDYGYYAREVKPVGRTGDFFTNVSVGSLFGELLAFQLAEWIEELDRPLQLVEAGSHDGRLASDILTWLQRNRPELAGRLGYWIIEPFARQRERQEELLKEFAGQISWFASWESVSRRTVRGVIFSNELLDAFPLHRIGWDATEQSWFEWGVTWNGDRFRWVRMREAQRACSDPCDKAGWPQLPPELLAVLPDGFTTEISPAAKIWWSQAAAALGQGRLLTIDYGLEAERFFLPERAAGTLRAYHHHRVSSNVLEGVGEQDLTADVNFTALQSAGEEAGLTTERFPSQSEFLTRIAEKTWRPNSGFGGWSPHQRRQFQTLVHPEHLGRAFRVFIQKR